VPTSRRPRITDAVNLGLQLLEQGRPSIEARRTDEQSCCMRSSRSCCVRRATTEGRLHFSRRVRRCV